jgi:transcriptional regulatory protein RtcR
LRHIPSQRREPLRQCSGLATSKDANWTGNFRDLTSSITRLVTLAESGRISESLVQAEIARLRWLWAAARGSSHASSAHTFDLRRVMNEEAIAELDLFDRVQLQTVLAVCTTSATISEAGRALFAVSRLDKSSANDTDRVRKYLAKFGLAFSDIRAKP